MVARIKDTFCRLSMRVHEGFEVTKMAAHAQLLQLNLELQPYGEMKVKNSVIILGKLLPKHNSSEQPLTTFYTKIFFTCYTECLLANVAFPLDSSQIKTF